MAARPRMAAARSRAGSDQGGPLGRLCRALPGQNVVAAGLAETLRDPAELRHRRGKPLSIYADTFGTRAVSEAEIEKTRHRPRHGPDPRGIREHLELCRPIYRRTAAYGHFGRAPEADGGFSWERRTWPRR